MVTFSRQYISHFKLSIILLAANLLLIGCRCNTLPEIINSNFFLDWKKITFSNMKENYIPNENYNSLNLMLNLITDSLRVKCTNELLEVYPDISNNKYSFEVYEEFNENSGVYNFYLVGGNSDYIYSMIFFLYDKPSKLNIQKYVSDVWTNLVFTEYEEGNYSEFNERSWIVIYSIINFDCNDVNIYSRMTLNTFSL